jgi:hypothetical protein
MDMTPKFLSREFHTSFFPSLLKSRLQPKERARSGFSPAMDHTVVLAICFILLMIGLPGAVDDKSFIGWVLTGLGAAGIAALLIGSIASNGERPDYDSFLSGFFFFFVALGVTSGVFAGTLKHSLLLGLLVGTGGLVAGYLLGILAGLWGQYLGWIAVMLNGLAYLAILGMFVVDLVLLSGALW